VSLLRVLLRLATMVSSLTVTTVLSGGMRTD
jgi:hypothetical protein